MYMSYNGGHMRNILIFVFIILLVAGGAAYYFFTKEDPQTYTKEEMADNTSDSSDSIDEESDSDLTENKPIDIVEPENNSQGPESTIGESAGGNDIKAYHFGDGDKELLFIGGIHGGYSWNTALVAFEMVDWLKANPNMVPNNTTITVIPVLNPDGLKKVTGTTGRFSSSQVDDSTAIRTAGRFNGNNVDLNRNFDCQWQPVGTWQNREVSGGKNVFSEPESQAIRNYVNTNQPDAVITWYSAAGGVYASNCKNGIDSETLNLTNLYAKASGYTAYEEFDYYEITGDMVNWFASKDIPAISVLLSNHQDVEWNKNKAGVKAVINHYTE